MRISELSKRSGFTKDTIRFYEKMGLICLHDDNRNKFEYKDYPETIEIVDKSCTGNCPLDKVLAQL